MESAWMPPNSLAPVGPVLQPPEGTEATPAATEHDEAGREGTARGVGLLHQIRRSLGMQGDKRADQAAAQQAEEQPGLPPQRSRGFSLRRMTSRLPATLISLGSTGSAGSGAACEAAPFGRSSRGCQLHIQCSFSAFTPDEVQAAGAAAARPGIVTLLRRQGAQPNHAVACLPACSIVQTWPARLLRQTMPVLQAAAQSLPTCIAAVPPAREPRWLRVPPPRRLSRQSRVPGLLRSGVLGIHLERAENLSSRTQAGFTRNL